MKIINQSVELVKQEEGFDGLLRHIERCGRVCYKSEDKITPSSARKFVEMLIKSGHTSVLEHGEVFAAVMVNSDSSRPRHLSYLEGVENNTRPTCDEIVGTYREYIECVGEDEDGCLWEVPNGVKNKDRRVTFHLVTDRGTVDELCRHRCASFSVESTRYCDYTKGKFGSELTFVAPVEMEKWTDKQRHEYTLALESAAVAYHKLRDLDLKPQMARNVLPLGIKSEMYMTAFVDDWINIIRQRTAVNAHPRVQALMADVREQLIKAGYATYEDFTTLNV